MMMMMMMMMIMIMIIIIIIIIITTAIIIPVVFKYRVGVRRGIAVSHGQVGVFSLGWQPS